MEDLGFLTQAMDFVMNWGEVALAVIGVFALVATRTPNTVDNKIAQLLADLVNFLGMNLGKAKNDPNVA